MCRVFERMSAKSMTHGKVQGAYAGDSFVTVEVANSDGFGAVVSVIVLRPVAKEHIEKVLAQYAVGTEVTLTIERASDT